MNEWDFTSQVKSRIDLIISLDADRLPFKEARCEQWVKGGRKRHDLTLIDKSGRVALSGEIKLPNNPEGRSPYAEQLVQDARWKAEQANAGYFFTWNMREFVLWKRFEEGAERLDRHYRRWTTIESDEPLDPSTDWVKEKALDFLPVLIRDFTVIHAGHDPVVAKKPDEHFLESVESFLAPVVQTVLADLVVRYSRDARFRSALDGWMRETQGWVISDNPEDVHDLLRRASRFASYVMLNRLVFYEAIRRKYPELATAEFPRDVSTADAALDHLSLMFSRAKNRTGDYETVFGVSHNDIGAALPFLAEHVAPAWADLVEHIRQFDFTKLDYEIIGQIFERLIAPEERHRFGQYYTRPEVVDLINSFCIRTGEDKVFDPACGGGTFLLRSYIRKKNLEPDLKHTSLISDLFGCDISSFAAHLSTINLATRDLVEEENYPRIARSDFLDLEPGGVLMTLPFHGPSGGAPREVRLPIFDAIVTNPPYVRQEEILRKADYQRIIQQEQGVRLSGRSDIHCYFWLHAASMLKPDGRLGFITSSQWLDVEYGFALQRWILANFEIVAILESPVEPWFEGARVATTVTILRRQPDEARRNAALVRFVQFKRPLADLYGAVDTDRMRIGGAERLRDALLSASKDTATPDWHLRVLPQSKLLEDGIHLGRLLSKSPHDPDEENGLEEPKGNGDYYGGKWGIPLRAPGLWFELLEKTEGRWALLGDLADVRFGIKSGNDKFFYVRDRSQDALQKETGADGFECNYRCARREVASGKTKIVENGWGEWHPVESKYLEPEVHSLMEVRRFAVGPEDCSRLILLVSDPPKKLNGTHVLKYIKNGERKRVHEGATCKSRVTSKSSWYDLTRHRRGIGFWSKSHQYKHVAPFNSHNIAANCNLYDIHPQKGVDAVTLMGILNSSLVVFSKILHGRPVGVEGNLKTEVIDVNMMPVPAPGKATQAVQDRIRSAFDEMTRREPLQFLSEQRMRRMALTQKKRPEALEGLSSQSELDMPDRHALDDAVLELLGMRSKKDRVEAREEIYAWLRRFYEEVRAKEETAIVNKNRTRQKSNLTPERIAEQILEYLEKKEDRWLRHLDYFIHGLPNLSPGVMLVPADAEIEPLHSLLIPNGVALRKGRRVVKEIKLAHMGQVKLLLLVSEFARGGFQLPRDPEVCEKVFQEYRALDEQRRVRLKELVGERSANPEQQSRILHALIRLIRAKISFMPWEGPTLGFNAG